MVFVPIVVRSRSLGEAHESRLAILSCEMALQVMTRWISGTCHAGDVVGGVLTCAAPHVGPNAPQPPEKHAHRVRKAWLGRSMRLFRSTGRFRGWNPQGVALPARREARIVHDASLRQALSLSPSVPRRCRGDRRHLKSVVGPLGVWLGRRKPKVHPLVRRVLISPSFRGERLVFEVLYSRISCKSSVGIATGIARAPSSRRGCWYTTHEPRRW